MSTKEKVFSLSPSAIKRLKAEEAKTEYATIADLKRLEDKLDTLIKLVEARKVAGR